MVTYVVLFLEVVVILLVIIMKYLVRMLMIQLNLLLVLVYRRTNIIHLVNYHWAAENNKQIDVIACGAYGSGRLAGFIYVELFPYDAATNITSSRLFEKVQSLKGLSLGT